jgi:toxin-antitoxin system PIN domain toxin
MFVVDTNVFLYAANTSATEHVRCRQLLDQWRSQLLPWHTTWGILYELTRVATHPRVFERPWTIEAAWAAVQAILAAPGLSLLHETDRHADVAREVFSGRPPVAGNLVFEAHTAVLKREHGVARIYRRDTAFHTFPFLAVIDPMA